MIKRLRSHYRVLWVNSIGTRQVKANSITLRRGLEKLRGWQQGLRRVAEQMWVIDLPMLPGNGSPLVRRINQRLVRSRLKSVLNKLKMADPHVITTLPYTPWLIGNLPRKSLIYYCTDDYSHWPSADRDTLQQADRELTRAADLILAASHSLLQQRRHDGRGRYFPHGVDVEHFAAARQTAAIPKTVAGLPGPRIGFFGLIYEKLDFGLLTELAKRFRNASLVMIGPIAYCPSEFAELPNVHLLGRCPYEELPQHIAGLDVLLLPYVDDEMIRQSGPLKLRECLASGKPTVSVDVPEVRLLAPHVRVAADREGFLDLVREALDEAPGDQRVGQRQMAVQQDGWDCRAEQLRTWLAELKPAAKSSWNVSQARPRPLPRILHLRTLSGKGGGPEKTILNSPRFLRGEYDMRLAYIRPAHEPEFMTARAQMLGANLVDIPESGPADPRTLWRLSEIVREYQPDILHAHDYKTNVLSVLLGRWFRIPVMTTVHGYVTRGGRLEAYYQVDRWALRQMDHVVAVSADLYGTLGQIGVPESRSTLVHNAIDTEQFARRLTVREAKQQLGLSPERLLIGAMGRQSAEKGFDLLIRAVDRVLQEGMDADLLVIGEGEEETRLRQLVAQLGRSDRIRLVGYRSDVLELYQALDLFALSSLREGLPNVLLEAMAMEVPCVATRIAGIPQLIEHGKSGWLVEPGAVEPLANAIRTLLTNPGLCGQLKAAARQTIETRYSFATRMQKIAALYDMLLRRN